MIVSLVAGRVLAAWVVGWAFAIMVALVVGAR